ncbi:hypothetical protein F5Y11DRAFT_297374 [Daldinia sp. FL1419]|nr:hypothetical protein F5Y11DRAFT_297374 [Daldinia sp. FL1419]
MQADQCSEERLKTLEISLALIQDRLSKLEDDFNARLSCPACKRIFAHNGHRNRHIRDFVSKKPETELLWLEHKQALDRLHLDRGAEQLRSTNNDRQPLQSNNPTSYAGPGGFLSTNPPFESTMGHSVNPYVMAGLDNTNMFTFDIVAEYQGFSAYDQIPCDDMLGDEHQLSLQNPAVTNTQGFTGLGSDYAGNDIDHVGQPGNGGTYDNRNNQYWQG